MFTRSLLKLISTQRKGATDETVTLDYRPAVNECSTAALAAPDSCERVKSDIQQKIINNGVPESGFTLSIVPNDQADQAGTQVVGHCANDTFKIIYIRDSSAQ